MAYEIPILVLSLKAGADLSAATAQYKAVKLDASGDAILCAATTDKPLGVLQNTPASGGTAEVLVAGVTKVRSDAALAIGDQIGTAADGEFAVYVHGTDTTKYIIGTVLRASGAAGGYATALVSTLSIGRAA